MSKKLLELQQRIRKGDDISRSNFFIGTAEDLIESLPKDVSGMIYEARKATLNYDNVDIYCDGKDESLTLQVLSTNGEIGTKMIYGPRDLMDA